MLTAQGQQTANELRSRIRTIMADVASNLRDSTPLSFTRISLIFARQTKLMSAALRFRRYRQWGLYVHHDEDKVLGVAPPRQAESQTVSIEAARKLFGDAFTEVMEKLDLSLVGASLLNAQRAGGPELMSYVRILLSL